jgi:hypothetical protein
MTMRRIDMAQQEWLSLLTSIGESRLCIEEVRQRYGLAADPDLETALQRLTTTIDDVLRLANVPTFSELQAAVAEMEREGILEVTDNIVKLKEVSDGN